MEKVPQLKWSKHSSSPYLQRMKAAGMKNSTTQTRDSARHGKSIQAQQEMEATDLLMQNKVQIDESLAFEIDSRGSLEIENRETISKV